MQALVEAVRRELAAAADPANAGPMQAYMKSAMPYFGVRSPEQKRIFRAVLDRHPLPDRNIWEATVRALWHEARFREERYAAIALTGHRRYRPYQDPASMALYQELIISGAWWDLVDELAIRRVGPILRAYGEPVRSSMLRWSTDVDLWKRRTSIICQVGSKDDTDPALLARCIEPNLSDKDFFIRKAIGWALRQYARAYPDWVKEFVAAHDGELSGLSRREALKHLTAN